MALNWACWPKFLLMMLAGMAVFLESGSTCSAGAVGGPQRILLDTFYYKQNMNQVSIEFEGGKAAHVTVSSDICGHSVIYGPNGKAILYKKFSRRNSTELCTGVATFTPASRSTYTITVINNDDDAKRDATFVIETD